MTPITDPADDADGLPIDDVVAAIHRWAAWRGLNDPWLLESAVKLGQEAIQPPLSPSG